MGKVNAHIASVCAFNKREGRVRPNVFLERCVEPSHSYYHSSVVFTPQILFYTSSDTPAARY